MPFPIRFFSKKKHATYCLSIACSFFFLKTSQLPAQKFFDLKPADSLHKKRLTSASAIAIGTYSASMIGLNEAWYKDYPRSGFHFFRDGHEWLQMDKLGHVFSAYTEARFAAGAFRWTGLSQKKSAWLGFGAAGIFQASFEVLDGFSSEYGFSWGDIGCNTLGSALFLGQELVWKEQRIVMKMSGWPVKYDNTPIQSVDNQHVTTLKKRADELYGTGPVNLFLKNYNTLVIWSSVNLWSFSPNRSASKIPKWLNVAVGHGANNLFRGAPLYEWTDPKTGAIFQIDPKKYPRERQFFLSLDLDLTKIRVKNRFLRTALLVVNSIKFPAPTLEMTGSGRFKFHPIYF